MLRIATSHEWARLEDNLVSVGITAYALEQLGDIVYLELPKTGTTTKAGQPFGEIESVKAASELFAPVDGVIVDVHGDLADDLDRLKEDPYDKGWMVRIRPTQPAQIDDLMTEAQYDAYLKTL
jgi:glycine cleavage system H protein